MVDGACRVLRVRPAVGSYSVFGLLYTKRGLVYRNNFFYHGPPDVPGDFTIAGNYWDPPWDGDSNPASGPLTFNFGAPPPGGWPNEPPTAHAGGPYNGVEGADIALDGAMANDPDDDPLTISWSVDDPVTCSFNDAGILTPNLTCSDDGTYEVTLTVDDGENDPVEASATVTVDNVAPTIQSLSVPWEDPLNVAEQGSFTVDVTFSDPAGLQDEPYTCAFDMDYDGETFAADVTVADVTGTSCSAALGYEMPGVYTVRVIVTDKDGGAGSDTATEYVVLYDPEGGFVTGGGWMTSPAGACAEEASASGATGKANFGFVSKYKKGATVPSGKTEFQFKAGDLHFKSTGYDWLVVAGQDKAKYKGEGTINGGGQLWLYAHCHRHGSPDTFRIKIWDKADGDAVVYDNKMGVADDGYDGTEIGGGNIKVHKK